jgi:hypothetical protein
MLEYFSISDIKKIFLDHCDFLIVGECYEHRGVIHRFRGIKTKIIAYDKQTFKAYWKYGIFYEFEAWRNDINGVVGEIDFAIIIYAPEKPNPSEWKRVHLDAPSK